jgi:azurin
MREVKMRRTVTVVLALAATIVACEKSEPKKELKENPAPTETVAPAATKATPAATESAAPAKKTVELEIASVGNTMAFDKTTLSVPAGSKVHLTMKNNGTASAMKHNWVLVKKGTEAKVALEGLEKAPDAGYVVPGDDVLAHTALTEPGATADVTFDAPPPGSYPYICTYPGHYVLMKGVLTVTP